MTLVYRAGLGRPLHASEYDGNIHDLDDRITAMEDNPPQAVSVDTITVVGNLMTITLTDASIQGPFALPVAHFSAQGEWLPDHPYLENDLVTHGGKLYIVNIDHTSPHTWDAGYSPTSGVDAYSEIFLNPPVTQTLTCQIAEEELRDDVTYYLVAPVSGVIVGIDAVIQRDLTASEGSLQVKVAGVTVTGALVTFSSGSQSAGSAESADADSTWGVTAGQVISVVPTGWGNLSGLSGGASGDATGLVNVGVRYREQ